jgi:hypothetical protein
MSISLGKFGTATPPDEVPQGVIDACSTFIAAGTTMAPAAKLDTIKLNEIGTDGKYTRTSVEHLIESAWPDGSGTTVYPPQVALVVSLLTNETRGLAARGRFYLPAPALGITTATALLNTSQVVTAVGHITTFLNAINTAMDPYRVAVASNVRDGMIREVKNVRVGNVLDTIRSRRTSIPETYSIGAEVTGNGNHWISSTGGGGDF